jgi:hypothetical protein
MNSKDKYEIDYWNAVKDKDLSDRYIRCVELLQIKTTHSIVDIGCGPRLGILPYVQAEIKLGVDPLMNEFIRFGLANPEMEVLNCHLENFKPNRKFQTTVCVNALDHGSLDFLYIPQIMRFTSNVFCLMVHLRKPKELNEGHDHSLTLNDFIKYTDGYPIEYTVFDNDPLENDHYQTLVARIYANKKQGDR